jgi:hypothetical protein
MMIFADTPPHPQGHEENGKRRDHADQTFRHVIVWVQRIYEEREIIEESPNQKKIGDRQQKMLVIAPKKTPVVLA